MSANNSCTLIGRLTKDPESKYTTGGDAMAKFTIAVDKYSKGEKKASFINVTAFRKSAEFVATYLSKGREVAVVGELDVESYKDENTGQYKTFVNIIASDVRGVGPKSEGSGTTAAAPASTIDDSDPFADE